MCQFSPSCSEYGFRAVSAHGAFMGTLMTTDRLMRCNRHAWASGAYERTPDGHLRDEVEVEFRIETEALRILESQLAWVEEERPFELSEDEQLDFARSLYRKGSYEMALMEFERFAFLFPSSSDARLAREMVGFCHARCGRWREAAGRFHELRADSEDEERWRYDILIGQCAARGGDLWNARRTFSEMRRPAFDVSRLSEVEETRSGAAAFLEGMVAIELGDYQAARNDFRSSSLLSWWLAGENGSESPDEAPKKADEFVDFMEGRLLRFEHLPERSPTFAGVLSAIIPGAGQVYAGRCGDALYVFLTNAAFIAGTVIAAKNDEDVAAWSVGVVGSTFYAGNILGAVRSAREYNAEMRKGEILDLHRELRNRRYLPESEGEVGLFEIYFAF